MTEQLTGLDFFEAAKIAFPKGWRVRFDNGPWRAFVLSSGQARLEDVHENSWFPWGKQLSMKKWDVEPREIYVYGVTHKDGISCISDQHLKPNAKFGYWSEYGGRGYEMQNAGVFPEEVTKYKLVRAEKPEEEKTALPWEPWNTDDLPEEEFIFFAIMESGLLTVGIWREWGSCYRAVVVHPVEDTIEWYFRVDESMLPEDLE